MIRIFLIIGLSLAAFSSCTPILSTNIPGSAEKSLPKEWIGKYEPVESKRTEKRDSVKPEKGYVIIEATRITWSTNEGKKVYTLDDSLRYSTYGQSRYISLLTEQGLYSIVKVIKIADTLELYSMATDDKPRKAELNRYFDKVEEVKSANDEYFKVTVIDKKLDAFFDSSVPSKEVTKLVRVN